MSRSGLKEDSFKPGWKKTLSLNYSIHDNEVTLVMIKIIFLNLNQVLFSENRNKWERLTLVDRMQIKKTKGKRNN